MTALIDRIDGAFAELQNALQEAVDDCEASDKNSDLLMEALQLIEAGSRVFAVAVQDEPVDHPSDASRQV